MWIWRVRVLDGIEIEEAGLWNALGEEGVVAIPAVVGQEPGCAEGDDAGLVGELAGVAFKGRTELRGGDEVGGE